MLSPRTLILNKNSGIVWQPANQLTGQWISGAFLVNPPANTIVVDTGPLARGEYQIHMIVFSDTSVGVLCELQQRNAANTANIVHQAFELLNNTVQFAIPIKFSINTNERLRVELFDAIAGAIDGSIFIAQLIG